MSKRQKLPIILASTSPRRIELMNQAHLSPEIVAPHTDETPHKKESPKDLVARLAKDKAESVISSDALKNHRQYIVLAADTIVVAPNRKTILGKPKNTQEAKKMLKSLAGKTHEVLTGYCLLHVQEQRIHKKLIRVVHSKVKMRKLSDSMIHNYVTTKEPMDKAGSYGAQGLGMTLIESIQGSYANVIGLPIAQVLQDLEKSFHMPLLSWIK